jgi:hypothetical protein
VLRPLNSRSSRSPDHRISSGSGVVGPRNQICHPPPKPVRQREPALVRSGLCLPAPAPLGRSDDIECVALFYEQPRVAASKPGHGLARDGPRETAPRGAGRTLSEVTGRGPCCVGLPGALGTLGLRKASPSCSRIHAAMRGSAFRSPRKEPMLHQAKSLLRHARPDQPCNSRLRLDVSVGAPTSIVHKPYCGQPFSLRLIPQCSGSCAVSECISRYRIRALTVHRKAIVSARGIATLCLRSRQFRHQEEAADRL